MKLGEVSDYSKDKKRRYPTALTFVTSRYSPLTAQIQRISTTQFLLNEQKQIISLAFTLPTFPIMFSQSHNWITKLSSVAQASITQTELYQCSRKELSNGICSLNPQEDRLAFSCLCELDKQGNITDYKFAKTVIRSRVKRAFIPR